MLLYSIQKSDLDLRKVLFKNIVLSGGSTLFKGFGDRLLSEIKKMSPKETQIKVRLLSWLHYITCNLCLKSCLIVPKIQN